MDRFIDLNAKSQIDLMKLKSYGITSDNLNLNNLKRDDWLIKTNRKIDELQRDITLYDKISERIQDTIEDYYNEKDFNVHVNKLKIEDSGYLGCFDDINGMKNTGEMNFQQCKQNAIDLGNSFFSLQTDGDKNNCYIGDDLGDIIKNGTSYNEVEIWKSQIMDETMNIKDPKLMVYGAAFAILNYDNSVIWSDNIKYVEYLIENNETTSDNRNAVLVLSNKGELILINTENRRKLWESGIEDVGEINNKWKPIENVESKYKKNTLKTGEFINQNETIPSINGKSIAKLGEDGILRIYKAESKCGSTPKVGNITGNAVHMINKTKYDIHPNRRNLSSVLDNGTYFNINAGECLNMCDLNDSCKAIEYEEYSDAPVTKCLLKSEKTKNVKVIEGFSRTKINQMTQQAEENAIVENKLTQIKANEEVEKRLREMRGGKKTELPKIPLSSLVSSGGEMVNMTDLTGGPVKIGNKFTTVYNKRDENYLDDRKNLGKFGYIDFDNKLYQYEDNMIKYEDDYDYIANSTTEGTTILEASGPSLEGASKCSEYDNCGGFIYDRPNKKYILKDFSMYPKGRKQYNEDTGIFVRKAVLDANKTCPKKTLEIDASRWNKGLPLEGKIASNEELCGIYKIINTDINKVNDLEKKINNLIKEILNDINNLSMYDTSLGNEIKMKENYVVDLYNRFKNKENRFRREEDMFKREGFTNKNCFSDNNIMNGSIIVACSLLVFSLIYLNKN